jgi:hypothetical protein
LPTTGGTAAVVDDEVGEVPGLVMHDKKCISSMPRHEKEDDLPRSVGSPKQGGGHRRNHGVAALRHRGGGSDSSGSSSEVQQCSRTCARRMGAVRWAAHGGPWRRKSRAPRCDLPEWTGGNDRADKMLEEGPFIDALA